MWEIHAQSLGQRSSLNTFGSEHFIFQITLFIFDCAGSFCCVRAFSSCSEQERLFLAELGLPLSQSQALGTQAQQWRRVGSIVVVHRSNCRPAYEIFPDQGSNPCSLHWQAGSSLLDHQGRPTYSCFNLIICQLLYQGERLAFNFHVRIIIHQLIKP